MKCDMLQPCRTMPDVEACLAAPAHTVPTVHFNIRRFKLPIDQTDFDFLSRSEINLFGQVSTGNVRQAKSGMSESFLTFDTPFIALGICLYAYGDPYAMAIPANNFGPKVDLEGFAAGIASPLTLRQPANAANIALLEDLLGQAPGWWALHPNAFAHPATISVGAPGWRAMQAFMHAYRLVMKCPNSAYETLMDEACVDLGNCCSQFDYDGFSGMKESHILAAWELNSRLHDITLPNSVESGYFVPLNCEQHRDGEIVPYRLFPDFHAMGRPKSGGMVEQWCRLPCPIPFTTSTKVKITFQKREGDEDFFTRMLMNMMLHRNISPVPNVGNCTFNINEEGAGAEELAGSFCESWTPFGEVSIGIGIKGFEVRGECAEELQKALGSKSLNEIRTMFPQYTGLAGPTKTPYCGPADTCTPAGSFGR